MIKFTIYLFAFALFFNAEVVLCGLPKGAAIAGSDGTAMSISITQIRQGFENSAVAISFSAQPLEIRTKHFTHLFHFKIPLDSPLQKGEELGEYEQMGKLFQACFLADKEPLLRMVLIRTRSSRGLKQLRGMHLDIIRVRADPDRAPGEELLSGGYLVEAVVTKGQLAKLKKMGFEVSEMSEKN